MILLVLAWMQIFVNNIFEMIETWPVANADDPWEVADDPRDKPAEELGAAALRVANWAWGARAEGSSNSTDGQPTGAAYDEADEPAVVGKQEPADGKAGALKQYLREIHRIPLLDFQQEQILGRRIQDGDAAALRQMIEANLRLVVTTARRFEGRGLPLIDLINEGNIGLMKAATEFDPERGFRFSTKASWWIMQKIRLALHDRSRTIRLPVQVSEEVNKFTRAEKKLYQESGDKPTDEELADEMDISPDRARELRQFAWSVLSLDKEEGDKSRNYGAGETLADTIADPEADDPHEMVTNQVHKEQLKQ